MQTQTCIQTHKPFMSIRATARATGVSEFRLRAMLRENTLPGFYSGVKYVVDVPRLLNQLRGSRDEQ